jgi:N-acetylneuraminic acid mutarotase
MKTQQKTITVRGKSISMPWVLILAVLLSQACVNLAAGQAWTKRADMPTPRYDFSTSVVNGKIYAIGGGVSFYTKTGLKTVEEYDPATDTWTKKKDMPTGRQALSTCVVNGRIYAMGGIVSPPGPGLSVVEEYDPATDTWTKRADMPTARAGVVTAVVNGKIYAIGGVANAPGPGLATVEEYDPVADTWTRKTDMPTARHFPGIGVVDGKIYVIGGIRHCDFTDSLSTVEEYDPATDVWTTKASMPTPRTALSALVVSGKIYAIGGAQSYTSTATIFSAVEEYDPAADAWTVKAGMPTARQSLSTSVVNEKIYAIGGSTAPFPWSPTGTVEAYDPTTSVWGSGSTSGMNDYQFAGTATLMIRGREESADLLVTLLEPPVVDANGVQHVKATHQFTFADGSSFSTSDQEIATPTETPGLHVLTGSMDIASGTGRYEGVTGQLRVVNGTIDFAAQPPVAQFEIAGALYEDTTGTGATTATSAYRFTGTATLTIHGQEKSADLLVTLLEPPVVDANGVQYVKATHEFTFADGSSFITSDQEIVTPTETPGLSTLIAIMDISSGTGMYEGVTGRLMANGTLDATGRTWSVQFEIAGAVCEDTTGAGATAGINDYQFAGSDRAVVIEPQAINTGNPMVAIRVSQRPTMIHDEPTVRAGNVYDRVVSGTGGYTGVLPEYLSNALERTEGGVRYGVGYRIVRACPAARDPANPSASADHRTQNLGKP